MAIKLVYNNSCTQYISYSPLKSQKAKIVLSLFSVNVSRCASSRLEANSLKSPSSEGMLMRQHIDNRIVSAQKCKIRAAVNFEYPQFAQNRGQTAARCSNNEHGVYTLATSQHGLHWLPYRPLEDGIIREGVGSRRYCYAEAQRICSSVGNMISLPLCHEDRTDRCRPLYLLLPVPQTAEYSSGQSSVPADVCRF